VAGRYLPPKAAITAEGCRLIIENVVAVPVWIVGLLAQEGAAPAGAPAAGQDPGGLGFLFQNPLLPIGILFFLFYVIVLAPEKKRKRKEQEMLSRISKNDRVVTLGGIHGVVVAAPPESDVVTVRIDDKQNVRIRVNRSAIARIGSDQGSGKLESTTAAEDGNANSDKD